MTIKTQFGIHTGTDLIPHGHVNYILNVLEFNMTLQCQWLLSSLYSHHIDKVVSQCSAYMYTSTHIALISLNHHMMIIEACRVVGFSRLFFYLFCCNNICLNK